MITFASHSIEYKTELKFDTSFSNLHGRYGVIALWKSEDGGYMNCINVMYKIDSGIIPECRNNLCTDRLQNFIRTKALQRFYKEDLITSIKVVLDVPVSK